MGCYEDTHIYTQSGELAVEGRSEGLPQNEACLADVLSRWGHWGFPSRPTP